MAEQRDPNRRKQPRKNELDRAAHECLYIARLRLAIFVNGCFWHGHECSRGKMPKSNKTFWDNKIERNRERDANAIHDLEHLGVATLIIRTCNISDRGPTAERIASRYREAE